MTFDESKVKRDKLGRFAEKDEIPEMKKDNSLFSGAGSENEDFVSQLKTVLDGTYDKESGAIKIGDTPKILQKYAGFPDLPLVINYDTAYLAMNKSGHIKGNYHDLGIERLKEIPNALNKPEYIFKSDKINRVEVLTNIKDKNNNRVFVVLEKNGNLPVLGKYKLNNIVITAFGPKSGNYIQKRILKSKILYKRKN